MSLPAVRRRFEPLKLLHYLQDPVLPNALTPRRHVLPTQKPAHELGSVYRLDLLSQRAERQPVNPREQSPVAPFDVLGH